MPVLTERQQEILRELESAQSLSLEAIEEKHGISVASAYRDIRALVASGVAIKTKRGLKIASLSETARPEEKCFFCGGPLKERSSFLIQMQDGRQHKACCPHCGLMGLDQPGVQAAFASDFLFGRIINVREAIFLLGSSVSLCCQPSVLCFASGEDARKFQLGFGGKPCDLAQALVYLKESVDLAGDG